MRVLILGGDGYLGWPTAMWFSAKGHDVAVVDNFARRRWHEEAGTDSLTPIASLTERIETWRAITGREIESWVADISEQDVLDNILQEFAPDAIVHYGEQPSAPWSMRSVEHAVVTQANNVIGSLRPLLPRRHQPPH